MNKDPMKRLSRAPDSAASIQSMERDEDTLIRVEKVGKIFCRDLKRSLIYGAVDCMRDMVPGYKGRKPRADGEIRLRKHEFWANRGISFEMRKGECLGLIGHNGAGKTTLLRMLNGLIKPDEGRVMIRGRIGALIALGAGFNPILSGRENVYVNGSILGMNKAQIDDKFDEILEFADIGKFIDAPVQNYSSGMRVRLGFAVASTLDNDILIVDEVLAVGDFTFKQKCLQRIMSFRDRGGCILFVSHNLNQLQMVCNKGVYLANGEMKFSGDIGEASNRYFEDIQKKEEEARKKGLMSLKAAEEFPYKITSVRVSDARDGNHPPITSRPVFITATIEAQKAAKGIALRYVILNKEQALRISTISSELAGLTFDLEVGRNICTLPLKQLPLVPENYSIRSVVLNPTNGTFLARRGFDEPADVFRVANNDFNKVNFNNQFGDIVNIELDV